MRFEVEVTGDVAGVVTLPKQIEFAAAKSLNDSAGRVQREIIAALDHDLYIRGNWMKPETRFGINTINASFALANPEATIFTRADWLLEEEGYNSGIKTPDKGGQHLANPDVENTRRGIRNKVKAADKARRLLQFSAGKSSNIATRRLVGATKAFKITSKSGVELIAQRVATVGSTGVLKRTKTGKATLRKAKGDGSRLIIRYALLDSVKVPQTKIFQRTAIGRTNRHYGEYFGINIFKALQTAKIK